MNDINLGKAVQEDGKLEKEMVTEELGSYEHIILSIT